MSAFSLATTATLLAYGTHPVLWPDTGQVVEAPLSGAITTRHQHGVVTPFALTQRNESSAGAYLNWRPADSVQLSVGWRVLSGVFPAEGRITGPGDLRFTTQARVYQPLRVPLSVWIAWDLKLPNAAPPLGTDETDTSVGLWVRGDTDRVAWEGGAFLWIAGHPHQLNAQDDAALVRARVYVPVGPGQALIATDWRVQSPRNPHDARLRAGWALPLGRGPVQIGTTAGLGLSPAAPDWQASLWLGLVPPGDGV